MRGFLVGASYPLRALRLLLVAPGLWPYFVVPVLLNVVVGVLIYAGLLAAGLALIDRLVAGLPPGWQGVEVLLQVVLVLLLLLVTGFVFVRFGVILGAPWYDALSARVEQERTGEWVSRGRGGIIGALVDVGRQVGEETQKLGFVVGLGLLLLLMNLIPGAGTLLATGCGIALGATIACLDFFGPSLSRRRLGLGEKLGVVRGALPASAGFGLVCVALVSVPLVNLLSIPLCVVAGTLFYVDRLRPLGATPEATPEGKPERTAQAATRARRTPTS